MITAGAFGFAARQVVNFDKRLKDIEVQAGLTAAEAENLKAAIMDTAQQSNIRLDPDQILSAFDSVIEKTGDYQLAMRNIENMALAIRASGADGLAIGGVLAGLKKLDISAPDEVRQAFGLLIEQGKAGAFTMQHMAREAGPLMASLATIGNKGLDAVRGIGAVAQVTQMATDSAAESSIAIQSLISEISGKADARRRRACKSMIRMRWQRAVKNFCRLIRLSETLRRLTGFFGEEARKALKVAVTDIRENGATVQLDAFLKVQADGGKVLEDAAAKAGTADAALTSLVAAGKRIADANLSEPIQDIVDALNAIEPEKLNTLFDIAVKGAAAAAGIWAANKAIRGGVAAVRTIRGLQGAFGAGRAGGLATTAAMATAQPVFVTNWPGAAWAAGMGREAMGAAQRRAARLYQPRSPCRQ